MSRSKIAIVGAGQIGGTLAQMAVLREMGDVVLFDIADGLARGKALDLAEATPAMRADVTLKGSGDYADIVDADVCIVTAGVGRKAGMSRDDLLSVNLKVMKTVGEGIRTHAPKAFVICLTNPLDAMTWALRTYSGLPQGKVVGMGGMLDAARFCHFLAREFGVSAKDVTGLVIGGHCETLVPVARYSAVAGVPLPDLIEMGWITEDKLDAIVQRTRDASDEISGLLGGTGAPVYAPAAAALEIAEAYLKDQKRVLPCSAYAKGVLGCDGLYIGLPAVIGAKGVERLLDLRLTKAEQEAFDASAKDVQEMVAGCKGIDSSLA